MREIAEIRCWNKSAVLSESQSTRLAGIIIIMV